jgi:hypothetical protein
MQIEWLSFAHKLRVVDNNFNDIRFEVLMAVNTKITAILEVTPCNVVNRYYLQSR